MKYSVRVMGCAVASEAFRCEKVEHWSLTLQRERPRGAEGQDLGVSQGYTLPSPCLVPLLFPTHQRGFHTPQLSWRPTSL